MSEVQIQSKQLSGMERIWFAQLRLEPDYDSAALPLSLPQDDLASLLTNPWKTLGSHADLPTDKPVTILFLYSQQDGGELNEGLIAEGISGTTFLTVRQEQPLQGVARRMTASEESSRLSLLQATLSDSPIEVVTIGRLAYAHYHLSPDEATVMAYRYAICRDPQFTPYLLNAKAQQYEISTRFRTIDDGSIRVIFQTITDHPPTTDSATSDVDPPEPIFCVKVSGTMEGDDFILDSVLFVRYRTPPAPTP